MKEQEEKELEPLQAVIQSMLYHTRRLQLATGQKDWATVARIVAGDYPIYTTEEVESLVIELANKEMRANPSKQGRPHGPQSPMKNVLSGMKGQPKGMPRFLQFGQIRTNGAQCFNCNQTTHYGADYSTVNGDTQWVCEKFTQSPCKLMPTN